MKERYLFRGKRIDNGEWVLGLLIWRDRIYIVDDFSSVFDIYEPTDLEEAIVDINTIGQCTGIKDKKDKLVFEDDIVDFMVPKIPDGLSVGLHVVQFNSSTAMFRANKLNDCGRWRSLFSGEFEVIGNIHDNPELLTEV